MYLNVLFQGRLNCSLNDGYSMYSRFFENVRGGDWLINPYYCM